MPSGHFSESTGDSMAVNTGKLFRTSEPSTQRSRSYCPFTDPTLQPNTCDIRSCKRGQRGFFGEGRGQDYRTPILAIPHALDARIDASRLDVFVPSGRFHAGRWMRTLESLLLRSKWRTRTAVSVYAPLPGSSPDVSTTRRGLAAWYPSPPLPDRRLMRRGLFRRATGLRTLEASWPRRTSFCRIAYL
jgi:hypothetical protein